MRIIKQRDLDKHILIETTRSEGKNYEKYEELLYLFDNFFLEQNTFKGKCHFNEKTVFTDYDY